jgi:hypothetical protein
MNLLSRLAWTGMLGSCLMTSIAQKLDESLLDRSSSNESGAWNWEQSDPGLWQAWIDLDAGVVQEFDGNTRNHVLSVGALGHPEWGNNKLTDAVDRMGYSGFNNAVDWQGWYAPRQVRVGAARQVWKGLSAGLQVGRGHAPAYVNCTRADGEAVVASWTQVRFGDFLDQYVYYDYLHDGNTWQYGNLGTFGSGLSAWTLELVAQHEMAFGLGWTASVGTSTGLQAAVEQEAASMFGAQGLMDPDELGSTLTPLSVAASPRTVSFGCTYRMGAFLTGLSWSSTSVNGPNRNAWVASGAEAIEPIQRARFRLGMNF